MIDRRAFLGAIAAAVGVQTSAKRGFWARIQPETAGFCPIPPEMAETVAILEDSQVLTLAEAQKRLLSSVEGMAAEMRSDFWLLRRSGLEQKRVLEAMRPAIERRLGPLAADFEKELSA